MPTCGCYAEALAAVSTATQQAKQFAHSELGTGLQPGAQEIAFIHVAQRACEKALPPVPGTVLDPCGGSGTTALAAQDAGVHWLLCEASAHYAETIAWPRIRLGSGEGKLPSTPKPAKDMPLFGVADADMGELFAPKGEETP